MVPWRREQEPPEGRECLQSTRTQTTLLIPSLSGKKILLYPHRGRKSKKGIRIQTKINKTSILGRWLEPIFSHTLKFMLWQRKTLHMKSAWGRSVLGEALRESAPKGWDIFLTWNAVWGWSLAQEFLGGYLCPAATESGRTKHIKPCACLLLLMAIYFPYHCSCFVLLAQQSGCCSKPVNSL